MSLWAANPHEYGPGKVHIVDDESGEKTFCGKWLRAVPGRLTSEGRATCKTCLNAVENRQHRELMRMEWDRESRERAAERAEQDAEFWRQYNAYLSSPAWKKKRALVLKRSNGTCEACLERRATQVHHVTYAHVFSEPCFELRAICERCHEELTRRDRAARVQN